MIVYLNLIHSSRLTTNYHTGLFCFYLIIVIWCSEGVAEVDGGYDGGYDEEDGGAEVLPPLEDHGMEVESEEWVERHQVSEHFVI